MSVLSYLFNWFRRNSITLGSVFIALMGVGTVVWREASDPVLISSPQDFVFGMFIIVPFTIVVVGSIEKDFGRLASALFGLGLGALLYALMAYQIPTY